jgi:hypothetical protein
MKTAGTSTEILFEKYCFPKGEWEYSPFRNEYVNSETGFVGYRGSDKGAAIFYNHMSALEVKDNLPKNVWDTYFKFTVIRNPFDKMVSAFFHFEKQGNKEKYIDDGEDDVSRFRRWVENGGSVIDSSAYLIDGKVALDYFVRFENLKNDIEIVCKKIGVDYDLNDLPQLKTEHRDRAISLIEMYDDKTESLVRDLYKFELDFFDYDLS